MDEENQPFEQTKETHGYSYMMFYVLICVLILTTVIFFTLYITSEDFVNRNVEEEQIKD